MSRSKFVIGFLAAALSYGAIFGSHYFPKVRTVDAIGLFSGGAGCGAFFCGAFLAVTGRLRLTPESAPAKQEPPLRWKVQGPH